MLHPNNRKQFQRVSNSVGVSTQHDCNMEGKGRVKWREERSNTQRSRIGLDNLSDADRRKLMLAMLELDNERESGVGHPTPDEREGKRVLH